MYPKGINNHQEKRVFQQSETPSFLFINICAKFGSVGEVLNYIFINFEILNY